VFVLHKTDNHTRKGQKAPLQYWQREKYTQSRKEGVLRERDCSGLYMNRTEQNIQKVGWSVGRKVQVLLK
jgi:hypothetical protein